MPPPSARLVGPALRQRLPSPQRMTGLLGLTLEERIALNRTSSRSLIATTSTDGFGEVLPSGEEGYRVPEARRPLLDSLPLPRYSLKRSRQRKSLRLLHAPPKPLWHLDMTQAQLYSSVLKFTEFQLKDEQLHLPERNAGDGMKLTPGSAKTKRDVSREEQSMRVVQPAFSELEPDRSYQDEAMNSMPDKMEVLVKGLEKVGTGQLPHPGLAMFGEALVRSTMADFITDMLPRIQSRHLDSLLKAKMSLSSLVNAAARSGIARGLGYDKELMVYNKVMTKDLLAVKYEQHVHKAREAMDRGSVDEDLMSALMIKRAFVGKGYRVPLTDAQTDFMEERMKLTVRHLFAFLTYACFAKGEAFVKAFVVRYLLPDLALQYFSDKPKERAWLEANNKWRFLPDGQGRLGSNTKSLPRLIDRGEAPVPVVIDGAEVGAPLIASIVETTLTPSNPMKELELVVTHDLVAKEVFRGARPAYKLLYTSHSGARQRKAVRVGVFARETLLAEGEGHDEQAAAEAAAQQALLSYYLNPQKSLGGNQSAPPPDASAAGA
eukprot:TRINITY_DN1618_c0_g1_i1.p1 TRINITY_DN1618_c0_g1~~TRINITY_DN1618_c0_g1_i1.p1  ORF type:complete len:548 (+),score=152.79 TRINITY_DN1618_c0_g1_i1:82-1725(+)